MAHDQRLMLDGARDPNVEGASFQDVLIHVGYHKTGSTFLQNHFFTPCNGFTTEINGNRTNIVRDIVVPDDFLFDPESCRRRYIPHIEEARREGKCFVLSHERLSGYPASGGYDRKLIADRLAQTFPGARVLIVIREQRSLIRSIYSQYITDGGDMSLGRFLSQPEPGLRRNPGFRFEVYEFDKLIRYYQRLFGDASVLVLPFEFLRRDMAQFLGRISELMNSAGPTGTPAVVANGRRPVTMQIVQRLANRHLNRNELSRSAHIHIPALPRRFARLEPLFRALTPEAVDNWLYSKHLDTIVRACQNRYGCSNLATSKLLHIKLEEFGYDTVTTC